MSFAFILRKYVPEVAVNDVVGDQSDPVIALIYPTALSVEKVVSGEISYAYPSTHEPISVLGVRSKVTKNTCSPLSKAVRRGAVGGVTSGQV